MKLVHLRDVIRGVPANWRESYGGSEGWDDRQWLLDGKTKSEIYDDLLKLDLETCTADEVAAVIGNGSWTTLCCDECLKPTEVALVLRQSDDYEAARYTLCPKCLFEGFALMETKS